MLLTPWSFFVFPPKALWSGKVSRFPRFAVVVAVFDVVAVTAALAGGMFGIITLPWAPRCELDVFGLCSSDAVIPSSCFPGAFAVFFVVVWATDVVIWIGMALRIIAAAHYRDR